MRGVERCALGFACRGPALGVQGERGVVLRECVDVGVGEADRGRAHGRARCVFGMHPARALLVAAQLIGQIGGVLACEARCGERRAAEPVVAVAGGAEGEGVVEIGCARTRGRAGEDQKREQSSHGRAPSTSERAASIERSKAARVDFTLMSGAARSAATSSAS